MRSSGALGRTGVVALVCALLAVAALLAAGQVRRLSRQDATLRNLQDLARVFIIEGAGLPGYSFATSEDAVRALVEAGHLKPEQTVSRATGRALVLAPITLAGPDEVRASAAKDPRTVLAYEALPAGASRGCVLFADGHGECVRADPYRAMVGGGIMNP